MFVAYWSQFPNNTGARGTLNRNGVYTGGNLNSRLLAEFDRKSDDGNAWTGSVREAWPGNAACSPGGAWLERWIPGWQALAELSIEAVQLALGWLGAAAPIVVWAVWGVGTLVMVGSGALLSLIVVLLREKPRAAAAA